ncbi:hypothetical protein BgiMline_031250, partial [Biomphalaria glabrata]
SLSLCEKEKNFTSVKTPMYGSFTIHICYITNFGPLEYCGVDNKPYRINDSEDNEDIYVSVEQFNNSTKYFMQINFRDITQDHTRKILWKTTPRQSLSYTVDILLLKEQNYELKNCEGQKFITYYYTNLLSNVSICVLIMSLANNQPCLQSTAYTQHGFANTSSKGISNVYISQLDTRYIQILLVPTKSQEMKIEFVSSNRILVYNISLNGLKTDENEIWKNNGTNNTTREFTNRTDSQGDALKNDNMDSSVYIYAVLVVAVIVCTVVLIIVFIVRKKAKVKREKVETQLNLYTQGQRNDNNYINVDNQNDVMYMNLKTSRPRSLRLVANAPDLTKDLDERIYLNTCDLEQESSFIGIGDSDYKDPPSGRYISDEGLLYVTVSHDNSLRSANSSASSRHTDNVIYASLDLEKSGKIPLLQFKQPRIKQKKKISDKKTNLNDFTITSSSPSQVNS